MSERGVSLGPVNVPVAWWRKLRARRQGAPRGSGSANLRLPNRRVQRTRSSASPPHSPLTRYPLGACAIAIALSVSLAGTALSCRSTSVSSVTGTARDTQGTPLPGVAVSLIPEGGRATRTVVTDGNGAYTFLEVPRGRYRVVSSFAGFSAPQPHILDVGAIALTRVQPLVFTLNPPETIETDRDMMIVVVTHTPVPR
jgi:Carboxypeptidase regulatory-like domain